MQSILKEGIKERTNKNTTLALILDKLLAMGSFFIIWIITAYVRWRFYLSFIDT
ncbi:uncharacterized protein NEPG_01764 [Nematocida parisii ERTm1]|uniref:Uncharacterized protein n=1 Tax=Nematocida parisii (strain ERTm3) TaxID=935791 RepID=I3EIH7_NEMP3|nr:uncharacterized protein NEPG_01764 [Nematocida parisii ERTm1]EIJ89024.1 hypothetical protein NEQG_00843 [Nematocida parisii ERTm3]KAI5125889.1 hypothetical protein NEPAR08_0225 [Nematocida parisii]EIJ93422.1 hypothetical protein NEPG_01764 [Nematocida parisii ERTm1]KAI5126154.1 hypothetical protein NEPAR03_0326 [Nematocida parisii]KAI5140399.1 hypothetical protein NEPAR04_0231 [Nematocida parisii]|eukprot:XP_013059592.1 hypothetical protein NEPG_01764 [Nematocida parisii ERTm1]